ncbi:MAG: T9SS type A sorting domain-containing protein, partial [Bacteroidales bacterium]|nr:T9SS type A sorting domain-containing protein [Bacteroidales bacterium]
GWVIEDYDEGANTWQWGEPVANTISTAASGINAFVTNLSGNYDNNEQGMVTSPCFDFSGMQRPMMKMDFIAYTEEDRDGAVIQYTKPNGDWATIGVPNDGINWYNSYIITGEPADQQLGWTGEIVGDDNSGWQTAMYRLDELRGRAGVRFRIVFGSNGDFTDEGFAFDNIQFGERKRIVLLENFTNIMDDDANITQEDVIDPILVKDSLDVINLNYHTSFPDVNNFNSFYPSGPSARALFYGVSAVPYSLVDGGERNYDYSLTNTLTESDIHKRMLIDPQFDISVRQDIQSNNFVVSSTVKALEEMTGQNVIVYVAIVEKTVLDVSDRYNNVLRTMLPDAAGILVEQDWIVGDSVNVYQIWSIHENVNTDSLITIVFVQDEDSKDIYQTAFTEEFSTITSVDEIIDNIMGIDYMVYPNPVKEILTVKLYKSLTHDINVNVYNSVGALVKSEKLSKGNYKLELNTNDLPSGVYYLRLPNTDKLFSTKKIIKTE